MKNLNIPGPDGPDREEYLRRVRKAGPPDQWVRLDEPTRNQMWNEAQQRNRTFDKRFNIVMALVIGAIVLIPALWACSQGEPEGEPPAYEIEEYEVR